jgi:hypothetical protein
MDEDRGERAFSAEGAVVEILERDGARLAKIVLGPGTVLELPAPGEISLGDRVVVDTALRVERVRPRDDSGLPLSGGGGLPHGEPAIELPGAAPLSLRDYEHALRMAGVFLVALVLFLAWRSWMVPRDFGVYGHYRASAIADSATRPALFGGQAGCIECHDDVQKARVGGRHATVGCEACHGALGAHARGETDVAPVRPSNRGVCLVCHTAKAGLPKAFPRIVVRDHSEAGPCTECHKAHAPGIS